MGELVVDVAVQQILVNGLAARLRKKRQKSAVRTALWMIHKAETARLARWKADKPACIQGV